MAEMAKLTDCTPKSLGLFVGGKCKLIGAFWELWELAFRFRMYEDSGS